MHTAKQIINDHQQHFNFKMGETFMWSPESKTIFYPSISKSTSNVFSLLHELGHALLDHRGYFADIELIKLERLAWEKAKTLAYKYNLNIPDDYIEDALDTYRDWLLSRARCPDCDLAGLQDLRTLNYACINCTNSWQVPDLAHCVVKKTRTN